MLNIPAFYLFSNNFDYYNTKTDGINKTKQYQGYNHIYHIIFLKVLRWDSLNQNECGGSIIYIMKQNVIIRTMIK